LLVYTTKNRSRKDQVSKLRVK